MISDNHNIYSNYIDEYELTDGYAVVDSNFSIVTANEPMYMFLGMSKHYSIIDSIHQVDLDDFIDVANSLKSDIRKCMCIRMRRVDNTYRWVLVDIEKKYISDNKQSEYLELHISDVLVMKKLNIQLKLKLDELNNKSDEHNVMTFTLQEPDIKKYCIDNIRNDAGCRLALIYFEVDNINIFKQNHSKDDIHRISHVIEDVILNTVNGRGVIGFLDDFRYTIILKHINNEVQLRAFLEHIRTMIAWNCKFIDSTYNISFSIGFERYPENGKNLDITKIKLQRAIDIARAKGGNRYIIYKEVLHGEIEDSDK